MALDENFLKLLACPICKGDLGVANDGLSLNCAKCKKDFEIKDGIPVLIA